MWWLFTSSTTTQCFQAFTIYRVNHSDTVVLGGNPTFCEEWPDMTDWDLVDVASQLSELQTYPLSLVGLLISKLIFMYLDVYP